MGLLKKDDGTDARGGKMSSIASPVTTLYAEDPSTKIVSEVHKMVSEVGRLAKSMSISSGLNSRTPSKPEEALYKLDTDCLLEGLDRVSTTSQGDTMASSSGLRSVGSSNSFGSSSLTAKDEEDSSVISFPRRIPRLSAPPTLYQEEHFDGRGVIAPTRNVEVDTAAYVSLPLFSDARDDAERAADSYPVYDEFSRVTVFDRSGGNRPPVGKETLLEREEVLLLEEDEAKPEREEEKVSQNEEGVAAEGPLSADDVEKMLNDRTVMIFVTREGEICLRKVDASILAVRDSSVVDLEDESSRAAVYHASVDEDGIVSRTRPVSRARIEASTEKSAGDIVIGHLGHASEILDRFGKDIRESVDPADEMDWDMIDKWSRAVGRTLAVNCVILLTGPAGGFAAGAGITAGRLGAGAANDDNREMVKAAGVWAAATSSSCIGQLIGGAVGFACGGPVGLAVGAIIAGCCCGIAGGAMSEVVVDHSMDVAGLDERGHEVVAEEQSRSSGSRKPTETSTDVHTERSRPPRPSASSASSSRRTQSGERYSTSGDRVRPPVRGPVSRRTPEAMNKKLQPKRRERLEQRQQQQAYF